MTRSDDHAMILIETDGRTLASGRGASDRRRDSSTPTCTSSPGTLPAGTRSRLVDAVLAHPEVDHADRLVATMPLGDTEMLAAGAGTLHRGGGARRGGDQARRGPGGAHVR